MTPRVVRHWMIRVGLIGGTALVLAACPEDAADITEVPSGPSLDFPVVGAYVEPVGSFSIERYVLADFDPNLTEDAFGRATGDTGLAFSSERYLIDDAARNRNTDPRLPALGGLGTEDIDPPSACRFGDGHWWAGSGGWDLYCFLRGLKPNTDYTVMLVRYALTVNGELDTEEMLLSGAITQPDELTLLGGTPGGYPTELCDFSMARPTFTVGVTGDQNPLVMGFATSDVEGFITFDCLVGSGGFWADSVLVDPDSAPLAPNAVTSFDLPRYNYVIVVEGTGTAIDPVPTGDHVLRFQVGVDIDASGTPVPNGLAPLPVRAATDEELLFGPGGAGKPDSLVMTFNNLEALTGGAAYEPWLVNPLTGSMVPVSGTYYRIKLIPVLDPVTGEVIDIEEDTVETLSDASGFVGGNEEDGYRHALVISDASLAAGDSIGLRSHVMLTITDSPGGGTPSDSRPLWFAYTDQNDTPDNYFDDSFNPDSGITSFGNFNASDPTDSRKYSGEGKGTGGVREDVLSVDLRNLSRPPVGYTLVAWLLRPDGTAFRLPDVTGPPPEYASLLNADVELLEGVVTETGIIDANVRVVAGEAGVAFSDFLTVLITLEPKYGTASLGPIPVQMGALPVE